MQSLNILNVCSSLTEELQQLPFLLSHGVAAFKVTGVLKQHGWTGTQQRGWKEKTESAGEENTLFYTKKYYIRFQTVQEERVLHSIKTVFLKVVIDN